MRNMQCTEEKREKKRGLLCYGKYVHGPHKQLSLEPLLPEFPVKF